MKEHHLSIWFLIGVQLAVYGVLIVGSGLYDLVSPPANPPVLASLHPAIWWGAIMLILGVFYTVKFRPKK